MVVSEVAATRSRGKTVNLVGRGKLNSSLSRQRQVSMLTSAELRITPLLARPNFHAVMGGVWERD